MFFFKKIASRRRHGPFLVSTLAIEYRGSCPLASQFVFVLVSGYRRPNIYKKHNFHPVSLLLATLVFFSPIFSSCPSSSQTNSCLLCRHCRFFPLCVSTFGGCYFS